MFSDSTILVIIGYSFPFFNREVDNRLISSFVNSDNSLKIYIQDPSVNEDQISFLKERFEITNIDIEAIRAVDQFFLPPQL